jgi:formylglycine-generating enzyme required for sulfatase activity
MLELGGRRGYAFHTVDRNAMTMKTVFLILMNGCILFWGCDTKTKAVDSCGDGFLDPGEACDGSQMTATTCDELGYYDQQGVLTCKADCTFDLTVCTGGRCGDGTIQRENEDCDGENLAETTCMDLNLGLGELGCKSSCRWETSGCELHALCGDGTVAVPVEVCEADDLLGESCRSRGFYAGELACGADCREFDTSRCTRTIDSPNIGTLIYVPSGTFQRDATATNLSTVSAFWMSQDEITREQWDAVTGWADPSNETYSSGTSDPVQMVSWYDAIVFCNKLSLLEGLTPVYAVSGVDFTTLSYSQIPTADTETWNAATAKWSASGYRLPTEMEWMWAAMGADLANPGAVNSTGYSKAFAGSTGSNFIGDYAVFGYNTSETGRTMTERSNPVGSKLANELGFYDLSGNVWEWVWDKNAVYPAGSVMDYRGPETGTSIVIRGGFWLDVASKCTLAYRYSIFNPGNRSYSIGFRVVRP